MPPKKQARPESVPLPLSTLERSLAERATRQESEIMGSFYFSWGNSRVLYQIETDEGFTLKDLLQELGRLELKAPGRVKYSDVPPAEG